MGQGLFFDFVHGVLWERGVVEFRLATSWEGVLMAWGVLGISPQGPRKIFWVCPMGQGTCLIFDWPGQRMQGSKGKRQKARGHKANKKATVDNPLGAPPTCA